MAEPFSNRGAQSARQNNCRKFLRFELATVTSQALKYDVITQVFLRKMLGTWYGPDFSDCRDPIILDSKDPMIIFSDSRDPVFNSRDPIRVPKTPLK